MQAGEDSLEAALRETKEETGLILKPENGTLFRSFRYDGWQCPGFLDVYVFVQEYSIDALVLQEEEVTAAEMMSEERIREHIRNGTFIQNNDMDYFNDIFRIYGG